ncbi:hypothetical protein BC832DRAFT_554415 [Gaertneriomyces semiglobifer]|nr:hypothetical protein BC832DRAFT_554415 [Gaertneriomyces semiglobifer]
MPWLAISTFLRSFLVQSEENPRTEDSRGRGGRCTISHRVTHDTHPQPAGKSSQLVAGGWYILDMDVSHICISARPVAIEKKTTSTSALATEASLMIRPQKTTLQAPQTFTSRTHMNPLDGFARRIMLR